MSNEATMSGANDSNDPIGPPASIHELIARRASLHPQAEAVLALGREPLI